MNNVNREHRNTTERLIPQRAEKKIEKERKEATVFHKRSTASYSQWTEVIYQYLLVVNDNI